MNSFVGRRGKLRVNVQELLGKIVNIKIYKGYVMGIWSVLGSLFLDDES